MKKMCYLLSVFVGLGIYFGFISVPSVDAQTITGRVINENPLTRNCALNPGETGYGYADAIIRLHRSDGLQALERDTNAQGNFSFNVASGRTYSVSLQPLFGADGQWLLSPCNTTIRNNVSAGDVVDFYVYQPSCAAPARPAQVNVTCHIGGDRADLSWSSVSGSGMNYLLYFNDDGIDLSGLNDLWESDCRWYDNDYCLNLSTTSRTVDTGPGEFQVMVRSRNSCGISQLSSYRTNTVSCKPSTHFLTGPTTISVGQNATYTASFIADFGTFANTQVMAGRNGTIDWQSPIQTIPINIGNVLTQRSFVWTPTAPGTYDVFSVIRTNISECWGNSDYTSFPRNCEQRSAALNNFNGLTVTVVGSAPPSVPGGSIINLNFAIANSEPWMQFGGSDARFDGGIRNPMPTSPSCGGGNMMVPATTTTHGIFFSGDSSSSFGQGRVSAQGWIVGGTNYSELYSPPGNNVRRTSFAYMETTALQSGITPTVLGTAQCGAGGIANCTLQNNLPNGVYRANGSLRIVNPTYAFAANRDYVFLVNGTLYLNGRIDVPVGSTATFTASQDIVIAQAVGNTPPSCPPPAAVEGFYSADRDIVFEGNNDCNIGADRMLGLEGSFVANASGNGGNIDNQRNLCSNNVNFPSVSVRERPDMILNAPEFIKTQSFTFQEVAP